MAAILSSVGFLSFLAWIDMDESQFWVIKISLNVDLLIVFYKNFNNLSALLL
jgi:hypothetical protein